MAQTRFLGFIHSIVGHVMMVSSNGDPALQEKCFIDDFESIMPVRNDNGATVRYSFNVKTDRIPSMPYHAWLGNERREADKLEVIEHQIRIIQDMLTPKAEPAFEPSKQTIRDFFEDDPSLPTAAEFAAQMMERKA